MKIRRQRPQRFTPVLLFAAALMLWAPSASAGRGSGEFERGFERGLGRIVAHTLVAGTHAVLWHGTYAPSHHTHVVHRPRVETRFVWYSGHRPIVSRHHRVVVHEEIHHQPRSHRHHDGCGHTSWHGRRWHH